MKSKFLNPAIFIFLLFISCTKEFNTGGFAGVYSPGVYNVGGDQSQFGKILENPFIKTIDSATSTFSIDADGASYATMRRWMLTGQSFDQIKEAIRVEEFINYFPYNYPDPVGDAAIGVNGEVSACPWNAGHKLIRIGIKGKSIPVQDYPYANFVLLIDVSGSMMGSEKLQTIKEGFIEFVKAMRPQDKIAIVAYAGTPGLVLDATSGNQKEKIISKINNKRC